MRLINIEPEEYGIKENVRITGTAVGSKGPGQSMFIIPIRGGEDEQEPDGWEVLPTSSGKPQIVANTATLPEGVLLRVSTYNRDGRRIGRIFIRECDLPHIICVGFGVGGNGDGIVTWEEAILRFEKPGVVYLINTGPPNTFVSYDGEEVKTYNAEYAPGELWEDDYIRIDDPRIVRWKPPEDFVPHA